jgi:2-oxoglutarate dehydrogenase E1 component
LHLSAGSGDVKYHLGTSYDRPTVNGKQVHISLLANPSHLEAVNTVVLGKCRARQFFDEDPQGKGTMPILLHGDGAFSGQVCTDRGSTCAVLAAACESATH